MEKLTDEINDARVKLDGQTSMLRQWNKHEQAQELIDIIDELKEIQNQLSKTHVKIGKVQTEIQKEQESSKSFYWEYIRERESPLNGGREQVVELSGKSYGAIAPVLDALQYQDHYRSLFETRQQIIPNEILSNPLKKHIVHIGSTPKEKGSLWQQKLLIWEI